MTAQGQQATFGVDVDRSAAVALPPTGSISSKSDISPGAGSRLVSVRSDGARSVADRLLVGDPAAQA